MGVTVTVGCAETVFWGLTNGYVCPVSPTAPHSTTDTGAPDPTGVSMTARVQNIIDAVAQGYRPNKIADVIRVSPSTVGARFRNETGMSITDYVTANGITQRDEHPPADMFPAYAATATDDRTTDGAPRPAQRGSSPVTSGIVVGDYGDADGVRAADMRVIAAIDAMNTCERAMRNAVATFADAIADANAAVIRRNRYATVDEPPFTVGGDDDPLVARVADAGGDMSADDGNVFDPSWADAVNAVIVDVFGADDAPTADAPTGGVNTGAADDATADTDTDAGDAPDDAPTDDAGADDAPDA